MLLSETIILVYELFELHDTNDEGIDGTLVVLSDTLQSQVAVCDAPHKNNARPDAAVEVASPNKFSLARRKMMFDDGGPLVLESTNKNVEYHYVEGDDGKLDRVEKKVTGRVLLWLTPVHLQVQCLGGGWQGSPTYDQLPNMLVFWIICNVLSLLSDGFLVYISTSYLSVAILDEGLPLPLAKIISLACTNEVVMKFLFLSL